jgi:hypothetical protein
MEAQFRDLKITVWVWPVTGKGDMRLVGEKGVFWWFLCGSGELVWERIGMLIAAFSNPVP